MCSIKAWVCLTQRFVRIDFESLDHYPHHNYKNYMFMNLHEYISPGKTNLRRWYAQIMISHPQGSNQKSKNLPWRWPRDQDVKMSSVIKYIFGNMGRKRDTHMVISRATGRFPK